MIEKGQAKANKANKERVESVGVFLVIVCDYSRHDVFFFFFFFFFFWNVRHCIFCTRTISAGRCTTQSERKGQKVKKSRSARGTRSI
mmetsp:Transcript_28706/g.80246  ORF Transcript_28706/g.80246 Transcript_28706/m.80246 type:complete len:87 (-) Transcript_28706:177-437(-)